MTGLLCYLLSLRVLELDQVDCLCRVANFSGFNTEMNSKASFRAGCGLRVVMDFDLIFESAHQYSSFQSQGRVCIAWR
jgi:hypothetical protein